MQSGRYTAASSPRTAEGWALERLTRPSRLFGANGLRTGPDGRIYVAQVSGSQISAIDVATGAIETISPMGSDIVAPDDLVFDPDGNLYVTEITEGRVSVRAPDGKTRVLYGDLPCANPITFYQGRLFAGECRPGGRIVELDRDGGDPRVLLENVPMPNAMEVGPDGMLYIPVMGSNEIWRVSLEGGAPQKVARELGVPDAVKFDAQGHIVSTQVASGQVLRIDPRSGERTVLADIAPGLDNLTLVGDRLFVSSISGQINEILRDGTIRALVPDGLNWPLGLALGADGLLFVADGGFVYTLRPGGELQGAGMLFSPGFPGYTRGVAAIAPGEFVVTTANGAVARFWPAQHGSEVLAEGFDLLYGVAVAPGGAVVFAEGGTGRVLSLRSGDVEELVTGLHQPMGVAIGRRRYVSCFRIRSGPSGQAVRGARRNRAGRPAAAAGHRAARRALYVVDVLAQGADRIRHGKRDPPHHRRRAAGRPPPGGHSQVPPRVSAALRGHGPLCRHCGRSGRHLYVSADAEGSVLALRPA